MSLFKDHIGINLTSGKLQVVEVCPEGNDFFLNVVDEEFFQEFFCPNLKETKAVSLLETAFHELQLRNNFSSNLVSFSLPNNFFKIVSLPVDETLMRNDLKENLIWNLSILFPQENFNNYTVQTIKVSDQNALIVVTININILKTLHKFCVRNNLILKYIDNAHLAANLIIKPEANLGNKETALSIYISESNFSVIIFDKSNIFTFHSKKITDFQKLIPAIQDFVSENINFKLSKISKSFICGENISDSLIEQIGNTLNIIPIKINPFQKIKFKNPTENKFVEQQSNLFVSAAGIAFRMV